MLPRPRVRNPGGSHGVERTAWGCAGAAAYRGPKSPHLIVTPTRLYTRFSTRFCNKTPSMKIGWKIKLCPSHAECTWMRSLGRKGGAHCGICPGTSKRDCFDVHRGIVRENPAHAETRRPLGRLGMSASTGGSARVLSFSAGSV